MTKSSLFRNFRRAAGFTLIELMVGMVVGLTATVVMFQVFAISEGQKRTTTGAGDAQQNGIGSVFSIERDARQGGFGMNYLLMIGCTVTGRYTGTPFTFQMAPFVVANGAGNAPDSLTIAYGDTRSFSSPAKIAKDMTGPAAEIKIYNRFGLALGDLFILASDTQPCTLHQVQARPGTDGIAHTTGGFIDATGNSRTTTYNWAGTTSYVKWDTTKRKGGRIINLGQSPTVVNYRIEGNQLIAVDVLAPTIPETKIVVSDNIVQFQVQYAFDFNGDGSVASDAPMVTTLTGTADQWADTLPVNPTTAMWAGIIGIRFALVARSVTAERPDAVSGKCPTDVPPKWLATGRDLDVSADANWKCYRYRVFEVTVPARNLAWAPDETL